MARFDSHFSHLHGTTAVYKRAITESEVVMTGDIAGLGGISEPDSKVGLRDIALVAKYPGIICHCTAHLDMNNDGKIDKKILSSWLDSSSKQIHGFFQWRFREFCYVFFHPMINMILC